MAKHVRLKHSGSVTIFRCSKCGSKCQQSHTLKEHYRDVHKVNVSIELVKSKAELDIKDEPRNSLRRRIKKEDMPKVACIICQKPCSNQSNLRRHMKRHTGSKATAVDFAKPKTENNEISHTNTKYNNKNVRTVRSSNTKMNVGSHDQMTKKEVLNASISRRTTKRQSARLSSSTSNVLKTHTDCLQLQPQLQPLLPNSIEQTRNQIICKSVQICGAGHETFNTINIQPQNEKTEKRTTILGNVTTLTNETVMAMEEDDDPHGHLVEIKSNQMMATKEQPKQSDMTESVEDKSQTTNAYVHREHNCDLPLQRRTEQFKPVLKSMLNDQVSKPDALAIPKTILLRRDYSKSSASIKRTRRIGDDYDNDFSMQYFESKAKTSSLFKCQINPGIFLSDQCLNTISILLTFE